MNEKPLVYLGGDIMSKGSNLARKQEYEEFIKRNISVEVYSPVKNESINKKDAMIEEQNNCLAEKITEEDIARLWKSDSVIIEPSHNAIGTVCELGTLYGWKYMCDKLQNLLSNGATKEELAAEIERIANKSTYAHLFDIRTNHLNEKDWRRSFSINQLLYGEILYVTADHTLHSSFEEALDELEKKYKGE